jgi:hypothetical protein
MFKSSGNKLTKPWLAYTTIAVLLLFRIYIYIQTEPQISGDANSYLKKAEYVAATNDLPPLSAQSNGYPLVLAVLVQQDRNETAITVGRIQQAMDLVIILALLFLAHAQLGRKNRLAFLALSGILILQPFTGALSSGLYTEQMVTFFSFFGVMSLSIGLYRKRGKPLISLGGLLLGLAAIFRADILLLNTVILLIFIFLIYLREENDDRLLRSITLLSSFLLVPILLAALQFKSTHEVGFVKIEFYYAGYMSWLRTWPADRVEYANFAFFQNWAGADIDSYPDKAFINQSDRREVSELLSDWRETGYTDLINLRFEALAAEKREKESLQYFIFNPLYRMAHFWINVDGGQFYLGTLDIKRPLSTVLVGIVLVTRILLIMLFVLGVISVAKHLIRSKSFFEGGWIMNLTMVSSLYVLGRTAELGLLGLFSWGGLMEVRFMIVAFPFFLVVCVTSVRMQLAKQTKIKI